MLMVPASNVSVPFTVVMLNPPPALAELDHSIRLAVPHTGQADPAPWPELARHYGLHTIFCQRPVVHAGITLGVGPCL